MFSKIVESRGDVCAVTNRNLHLLSELQDGTILAGQHRITGKEVKPVTSPIQRLALYRLPNTVALQCQEHGRS